MQNQETINPTIGDNENRQWNVPLLGFLTLLTISAAALLHVNQPEFILDRFTDITEFDYALFDGVLYLAYLIFGIITGALSDRWRRRRIFLNVGAIGSILFYFAMTLANSYPILLLLRFFQGAFTVMIWQTLMTLVLDFSGFTSRGKNMGVFGAFLALAMGLGPAVGGVIASYGLFIPYYTAAILNGAVLLLAFVLVKEPSLTKQRPSIRESMAIVKRRPILIVPGIFNFIDRLHIGFILTVLPLFLSTVLGLSEALRGFSLAIFALPFIILQYPMGRLSDRYGRYLPLMIGSLGYGIVLTLVGYLGSIDFQTLLLLLAVLGTFSGISAPANMALVGDSVDSEDSAMGMGFFNLLGNVGIALGPILLGIVLVFSNFVLAFVFAGILEFVTLLVNFILIKRVFKVTI